MKIIRLKLSQLSEVYVVVAIDPTQIISEENRPRKDRMRIILVTLMPDGIKKRKYPIICSSRKALLLRKANVKINFKI
ncbi:type IVB secretion system protein IcmQ [Coxiella-like endosymbiont of Rhipicephalus sanguineus]|uniref:type IVB secretion system protein IcmQ n=1 Tax=Coxiella-like endosymbiont of Rhipicephalus sanguineus TaxID=1955402 RepID=UPI00203E3D76|nr:type IVB secretion system protein IcmQ [Coxiella-like endosymbiont of Rhipicephalus sanguineus]